MSAETDLILAKAKRVRNGRDAEGNLIPAIRFYRHREKAQRQDELNKIETQLAQPAWANAAITPLYRQQMLKRKTDLKRELNTFAAPTDLSDETKNAVHHRIGELETEIREGLICHEDMIRNPPGAVDRLIKFNRAKKDRILELKNLKLLREPLSDEQDLCNIETLRRWRGSPGEPSEFMVNAQLPGKFGMSSQAKENWPENMPEYGTADSAMKQVERREQLEREIAQLEAKKAALLAKRQGLMARARQVAKAKRDAKTMQDVQEMEA